MKLMGITNNSRKILCGFGIFITSLPVCAAGFDCSIKNLNATELAICNDSYLSGIDNALNKFFSSALENSVNHGTLYKQQRQWVKERNQCADDIDCIKQIYVERNKALTAVLPYQSIDEVFDRDGDSLDPPMAKDLTNKYGFTLTEDRWRVKLIVPDYVISSSKYGINSPEWQVLTHRVINGDLVLFFLVSGWVEDVWVNYIVRVSDAQGAETVARYSFSHADDFTVEYRPESTDDIIWSVFQRPDPESGEGTDYTVDTYKMDIATNSVEQVKRATQSASSVQKEAWIGYCETQECTSTVVSPDGKWRLASRDGYKGEKDEGMFYFPADKPDQGINVFLAQGDTSVNNDYGYMRNYVWGDDSSFYFDNEGAYACIWKTDIKNKTTQRILPIEEMSKPYYLKYNDEDIVIASYSYYQKKEEKRYYEIYMAKK
uniref:lysozyme inhibitor LprI family protein n=1 Tax=Klebsiella sp. TaxID=576 RepID=UPI00258620F4|nr:hypothetical protein [Klebsiella sp.]